MAGWLDGWLPLCHGGCATHHLSLGSGASPCATIMRIPTAGHASIALECHDSTNFQDSCWRLRASFDIRNPLPPALRKEGHPCVICRFGSLSTTSAQPPLSTSDLTPVCLVQRSCRQRSCPQEPGIAGMSESSWILTTNTCVSSAQCNRRMRWRKDLSYPELHRECILSLDRSTFGISNRGGAA
ncbi:hypothetical protein EDB80DRAFT_147657 [Ilyonectria destructans]|nr:hypothetical protein EDB80DRAFT_147657 [Ilyonectria destructans]